MKNAIFFVCLPAFLILFASALVLKNDVGQNHDPIPFDNDLEIEPDFRAFLMEFQPQKLPFEVNEHELTNRMKKAAQKDSYEHPDKILSRDYSKFLPAHGKRSMFSRMPEYIIPLQRFENEQVIAVVYALERGYSRIYRSEYIATFDRQGKPLGTHPFLKFSPTEIMSVRLDENFVAHQKTFRVKWKNKGSGYKDNQIVGLTLQNQASIPTYLPNETLDERQLPAKKLPEQPSADKKQVGAR